MGFRDGHHGSGPGAITPDGCAVDLYLRLPVGPEPDVVAAAVPAGASILELGCGVGRVTRPLLERGFSVTAVDESAEMLSHVDGTRTVLSPIETLDLGETFDVVLLASFLVNTADPGTRRGMFETCLRHLAPDGCILIQRERDGMHDDFPVERTRPSGEVVRFESTPTDEPGVRLAKAEYVFPDATWTQTFEVRPLVRAEFERVLGEAGLAVDAYLTEDETWVRVRPSAPAA